jgi:enoyl-CoA hydratase
MSHDPGDVVQLATATPNTQETTVTQKATYLTASTYQTLLVEPGPPGVLVVTLNRPEEGNAVNRAMHEELLRLLFEIRDAPDLGAIVLTGSGRVFCGGGSMSFLNEVWDSDYRHSGRILEQGISLVRELLSVRPPVVVALNGGAVGLGATLALLGDIIVMADTAKIADTHVKVGIVAGDGGTLLWPSRVGMARAKQYLLTGDTVTAEEALAMGLVNAVVPKDQVRDTALEWAKRFADGPRLAIAYTKQAMNATLLREAAHQVPLAMALEARTFGQPDVREGIQAFVDKRQPSWPSAVPESDATAMELNGEDTATGRTAAVPTGSKE